MEGLTFVITGVLESIERDDAADLVQRYGGKVTGSVSKKTSFIVVGRDAGESKLSKVRLFHWAGTVCCLPKSELQYFNSKVFNTM